jgi:glyoxylase-like metal-dependent hydrolase (beta-lactamase superfamily II)
MDKPTMFDPYPATPEIDVLPSYFPIPVLGIVPINAFLLKAAEPVLVDTGQPLLSDEFLPQLASVIDPADLRWLWLTHADPDHIGSLHRLLDEAPNLRVITTFLALGKLSLFRPLPPDRVYLLNPGQSLEVGDRTLTAVRPPTFDAPETTGFYDSKSGVFFSADSFGALMSEPAASAAQIAADDLREGLITWTTIDSPWLHLTDYTQFMDTLDRVRDMAPTIILSSHLPMALDMNETLLGHMAAARVAHPFMGLDQPGLEALLRQPAAM